MADFPPIGFSTGCLHLRDTALSDELIHAYLNLGVDALELSVSRLGKLGDFPRLDSGSLSSLRHLSLHGPVRMDENFTRLMTAIDEFCRGPRAGATVVLHPDIFHGPDGYDFSPLREFHLGYALENMDARKEVARTVPELHEAFAAFSEQLGREAGFVLDVNHSHINDPTGELRNQLITVFGARTVETHASSYVEFHEPFLRGGLLELLDGLPPVPIILESGVADEAEAQQELDVVRGYLHG
jgi:hypothetical protein